MVNERIKQLAEQATLIKEVHCEGYLGRSYTRQEEYFDKEKFALLIVRECQKLNSKELSITAIERLLPLYREHFGVEE